MTRANEILGLRERREEAGGPSGVLADPRGRSKEHGAEGLSLNQIRLIRLRLLKMMVMMMMMMPGTNEKKAREGMGYGNNDTGFVGDEAGERSAGNSH